MIEVGLTQNSLFDHYDQVIIYGANGWMGRSAVDFLSRTEISKTLKSKLLLIGSRRSQIQINSILFDIESQSTGFSQVSTNAIFLNAAFLRREFLQKMSAKEYIIRNSEISDFAKRVLEKRQLRSFINLSSGVARENSLRHDSNRVDIYAKLKKALEDEFSNLCKKTGSTFINCRIFSLSGKYLNEFNNLALSSMILQARRTNRIEVKSPMTKRTYVDAEELVECCFKRAMLGESEAFDSGGSLVTILELATTIKRVLGQECCDLILQDHMPQDYFGDYKSFNSIAKGTGVTLSNIEEQILKTLTSINSYANFKFS